MFYRRNVAIQASTFTIAKFRRPRFSRIHLFGVFVVMLAAGMIPVTMGAQAGSSGEGGQSGSQTACGPGTAIPCPAGTNATGAGATPGQATGIGGATQVQNPSAPGTGAQAAGKANGAQSTAPTNPPARRPVPETVENPEVLSGCPATLIEEETNPAEGEANPSGAEETDQNNPNANPAGTRQTDQNNPNANRAGTRPTNSRNPYSNPTGAPRIVGGIPYCDIPSLRDLNQLVPNGFGEAPKRFGSDVFYIGTGNTNELPMDLPVGPDYVLGPGDDIVVNMWGGQSQRLNELVDPQGQITLPEAGAISVTGLTIAGAQTAIQAALNNQFHNEQVEISLGRVRTVRVYVVGDVQQPGAYDLSALSTPLNALFMAGGPTARGSLRILRQYRGGTLVKEFDLYDFLLKGLRTDPGHLQPGDTILVPPVGPQVTVRGYVHRPAIYELHGETTLDQVLDLAGGPLVTASLKEIHVGRVVAHERRTMLDLQLPNDHAELVKALSSFQVQDGDNVLISPILPYNKQEVYLEGHVYRPGRYPYQDGMTINDLIHSYQDVMPEPADHAELIRLLAPDYRPEAINLNLPDILAGNDPMPLQPFDVVRIYGRYEIDPPLVRISGQVLRPGEYPMSKGMKVADLVRMAGGFTRGAYRKEADLSSYSIENGDRVLVKDNVVQIEDAMRGDQAANVALEPGDVLGIRQLTGWQDIGAAITVIGEVQFSGTYAVEEGERLSSVLKRAGGFRADAFPEGAVLNRISVRDLEEKNRDELIRRITAEAPATRLSPNEAPQNQQEILQAMHQEQQEAIASLSSHPVEGRLVIRISNDISKWANTPADIVVRAGDRITIPRRPEVVVISGQVYNPGGIFFEPGRDASWYLQRAGGVTDFGDKKHVFVIRANGEVVARPKRTIYGGQLSVRIHTGDSIIVPEKVIGGSLLWRNLIATAQVMSSVALTGAAVGAF
jgi:protein involved in polysaccharide export with SLBB domain